MRAFVAALMAVSLGACEPPPDVVVPLYDSAPVETRPIQVNVDAAAQAA